MAQYRYDREFQLEILKLLLQSPTLLATNYGVIKPQFFTDDDLELVCRILLTYYNRYHSKPECAEAKTIVASNISDSKVEYYTSLVDTLYNEPMKAQPEFVEDNIRGFGGSQAILEACQKIIDELESGGGIHKARELIDRALLIGSKGHESTDINNYIDYENLVHLVKDSGMYINRIKTLIKSFDERSGGLGIGELGVIIAPPKTGKTTTLVNLGFGAVVTGNKVLHLSLEPKEVDLVTKYFSRLTGMTTEEMLKYGDRYTEILSEQKRIFNENKLRMEYYKPGELDPSGIRTLLNHLNVAFDFKPDLIIIDYADRMKVERSYDDLGKLYDDLIGIAEDYKVAIWTASQGNRNAMYEQTTEVTNAADSWLKIANADMILTLNQTKEEKNDGKIRIMTAMSRRGADFYQILCSIDYGRCTMEEIGVVAISQEKKKKKKGKD